MKFKSEVLTQASGSIGGTTYAHNRGGMYRRARSIPVNPNSTAQQAVRANFSMLSSEWGQVLTQAQRDAWSNYAANNPITDVFGDPLLLTGQQMFIRCNTVQMQAGLAPVLVGPALNGMVMVTPAAYFPAATASILTMTVAPGDPWAGETGAAMNVFISRQQSPSINFFRSPFRLLGTILGDTTTPATGGVFPDVFGGGWLVGNKLFFKTVVTRADGRISAHQSADGLIT